MKTQILSLSRERSKALELAAEYIKAGEIVAFPTETVYGLGGDGLSYGAVRKIFEAKGRPSDNPLILHVACPQDAATLAREIPERAQRLMEAFWPGPLTLVLPKSEKVPDIVTAGLDTVAIRCPENEYARELIGLCSFALAAPSANASTRPSPTRAEHVYADLNGKIPLILDGGECAIGIESTVVALTPHAVVLRPGGVTQEMLEGALGEPVGLHEAVLAEATGALPSPGMRHKHYAPAAEVYMATGEPHEIAEKARAKYDEFEAQGKKCVILATEQTRPFYFGRNYVIMGDRNDPGSICKRLFTILRNAEGAGSDVLIIESLKAEGIGLAFMNRALRSAGFRFI